MAQITTVRELLADAIKAARDIPDSENVTEYREGLLRSIEASHRIAMVSERIALRVPHRLAERAEREKKEAAEAERGRLLGNATRELRRLVREAFPKKRRARDMAEGPDWEHLAVQCLRRDPGDDPESRVVGIYGNVMMAAAARNDVERLASEAGQHQSAADTEAQELANASDKAVKAAEAHAAALSEVEAMKTAKVDADAALQALMQALDDDRAKASAGDEEAAKRVSEAPKQIAPARQKLADADLRLNKATAALDGLKQDAESARKRAEEVKARADATAEKADTSRKAHDAAAQRATESMQRLTGEGRN